MQTVTTVDLCPLCGYQGLPVFLTADGRWMYQQHVVPEEITPDGGRPIFYCPAGLHPVSPGHRLQLYARTPCDRTSGRAPDSPAPLPHKPKTTQRDLHDDRPDA